MNWNLTRSLLFKLDPEKAHNLAIHAVQRGWVKSKPIHYPQLETNVFGLRFPNRIGLAAGFDKNGLAINRWKDLGFGFVEIGTVTRHAQPGNPKPRMFRLPEEKGIINRLGFNNLGADSLAKRLESAAAGIPLGINLGKSKVTELEDAAEDYAYSFQLLRDFGDYFVVNVSSPNTPGLRSLQDQDALKKIFWRLKEIDEKKPLLVKLAPDLSDQALADAITVSIEFGLSGIIATNTTLSRQTLRSDPQIEGGLSGLPLQGLADSMLEKAHHLVDNQLKIIGVGGINDYQSARRKLTLGAELIQVYSGWIYAGPNFVNDLNQEMSQDQELISLLAKRSHA